MKKLLEQDFQKAEKLIEIHYSSITLRYFALENFLLSFCGSDASLPTYVEEPLWVIKNSLMHGIAIDLLRMVDPSDFRDNFDLSDFIFSIDDQTAIVPAHEFEELKKEIPGYIDIRQEARAKILSEKNEKIRAVEDAKQGLKPFRNKTFSHADLSKFDQNVFPQALITTTCALFIEFTQNYYLGWKNRSLPHDYSSLEKRFGQAGLEVKERLKW